MARGRGGMPGGPGGPGGMDMGAMMKQVQQMQADMAKAQDELAAEVVEAAGEPGKKGRDHFVREVGDLVYHLLVLMQHKKCSLADLEAELARRFGVSGLDEKASRRTKGTGVRVPRSAKKPKPKS